MNNIKEREIIIETLEGLRKALDVNATTPSTFREIDRRIAVYAARIRREKVEQKHEAANA